jgi:uncharacterized membrane protein YhaH (DUF805 family)
MTATIVMAVIGGGLLFFLLTCWALMDVAARDFGAMEKKAVWGLVAFIPFFGWMIYLVWGRKRGEKRRPDGR